MSLSMTLFSAYTGNAVKPVLSSQSKIDKTNILLTMGSLIRVKSIVECSLGALCNTFDLHNRS